MSAPSNKDYVEPDDLNVGLIATITIVGALLVIAIAAALTALVRSESNRFGVEVGAYSDLGAVARLKADQRAKLSADPTWVDQGKGLVAVPIDRAMTLVTADIQRDPNLASAAPPPPPPAPAETAAPAAEKPATEGAKKPHSDKTGHEKK